MKYLRNRFIAGLLILIPAVVTGWIIWKIFSTVDNILGPVQERFPIIDFPGVGFAVVVLLIFFAGVFASNLIGTRIIGIGERTLYRLPIIRRIYVAVKELSEVFLADRRMVFKEVVVIRYPHAESFALGFVTQASPNRLSEKVGRELLNVFVPTTPNPTSGFLVFIPSDQAIRLPITVEEGLKMVISGGVFVPPEIADEKTAEEKTPAST